MGAVLAWAAANPELAMLAMAVIADILAGWLPDKYTKWPGLILGTAKKMYYNGKEGDSPPDGGMIEDMVQRVIRRELAKYAKPKSSA